MDAQEAYILFKKRNKIKNYYYKMFAFLWRIILLLIEFDHINTGFYGKCWKKISSGYYIILIF